jgi:hypothetical protein
MQIEERKLDARIQRDAADIQIAEERLALEADIEEQKLDLREAQITIDAMD